MLPAQALPSEPTNLLRQLIQAACADADVLPTASDVLFVKWDFILPACHLILSGSEHVVPAAR